jgi:hypothetical protein
LFNPATTCRKNAGLGGKEGEGNGLAPNAAVSVAGRDDGIKVGVNRASFEPVSVPELDGDGIAGKHAHRRKKRKSAGCFMGLLISRYQTVCLASIYIRFEQRIPQFT